MKARNYFIWSIVCFAFLFSVSLGCFSALLFEGEKKEEKDFLHTHLLEQNEQFASKWQDGQLVRDYQKTVQRIDRTVKQSLLKSGIKLADLTRVGENEKSRVLNGELVNQVVWQSWEMKASVEEAISLPTVVLQLEGDLKKIGAKVVETVWEENNEIKFVRLKIGFLLNDKEAPCITHHLEIKQNVQSVKLVTGKGKLAIIIDDWGALMQGTKQMLAVPYPLTAAVLPNRPHTSEEVALIKKAGKQLILHMPMEPLAKGMDAGPGVLKAGMQPEIVKQLFYAAIKQTEGAQGSNNHMGSKASQDRLVVTAWLEEIKKQNLFVIDSKTSHQSVIVAVAEELGIPYGANDLFLDNEDNLMAIEHQIRKAGKLAHKKGSAIVIGHVRSNTAKALASVLPELEESGIKIVFVSELLKK